jgi:C2 domain
LFALKCQEQNSRIPLEDLNQHLQTVLVDISPESYDQIRKATEAKQLPPFFVRLDKIAARKLKPRYSKGTAHAYVVLYLMSSPSFVQTTKVIYDTLSPEWETSISL